jgi:hypothetical protein
MMLSPDENHVVNPHRALERHAVMCEEFESGKRPAARIGSPARRVMRPPVVSAEVRAEYGYELVELAGRLMDSDASLSEADADRLALEQLGCVEFWDYAREHRFVDGLVRAPRPRVERREERAA